MGQSEPSTSPGLNLPRRGLDGAVTLAAVGGGFVILAAAVLIVVSIIVRWTLSTSVPGNVELVQNATAIAAAAFLPFGQLSRSIIVIDTFTLWMRDQTKRRIDAAWDFMYSLVALVLSWRLVVGGLDAISNDTATGVLRIKIGYVILVCAGFLFLLALAALVSGRRRLAGIS